MPFKSCLIDLSKIPEAEQPLLYRVAEKHNALCHRLDPILGHTFEDVEMTTKGLEFIRGVEYWFVKNKLNALTISLLVFLIIETLKLLGVPTQTLGPLIWSLVSSLQGGG